MKNEPFFSFTAAIVLAGVAVTFVSPAPAPTVQPAATPSSLQPAVMSAPVAQSDKVDSFPSVLRRHNHRHAMQKS